MSSIEDLIKMVKTHWVVVILGLIVLYWAMNQYSVGKMMEGMTGMNGKKNGGELVDPSKLVTDGQLGEYYKQAAGYQTASINNITPSTGLENIQYAPISGMGTNIQGLPPSCTPQQTVDPLELLPKDVNSQWAQLNPVGAGDLKGVNLLSAGALIGIDTIGNTLRNANLQVRSEPPNPQLNVGPWNNSTIAPDLMRVPLEIGCGGQ